MTTTESFSFNLNPKKMLTDSSPLSVGDYRLYVILGLYNAMAGTTPDAVPVSVVPVVIKWSIPSDYARSSQQEVPVYSRSTTRRRR